MIARCKGQNEKKCFTEFADEMRKYAQSPESRFPKAVLKLTPLIWRLFVTARWDLVVLSMTL